MNQLDSNSAKCVAEGGLRDVNRPSYRKVVADQSHTILVTHQIRLVSPFRKQVVPFHMLLRDHVWVTNPVKNSN
jgi:hypothetical protein